ncbi:hypothetical protein PR202_gb07996 [Eleusine coracana subsp. coracana]|uniref:Uncharacterized protein n=1 Tax=Eleusine coracana subsp. coracana TaxID=191504 RepID=A0AAV5ED85_ELECO|nr:hypothetical protein PR202_gb07996 [Eleusine coracana subsp. coracana]
MDGSAPLENGFCSSLPDGSRSERGGPCSATREDGVRSCHEGVVRRRCGFAVLDGEETSVWSSGGGSNGVDARLSARQELRRSSLACGLPPMLVGRAKTGVAAMRVFQRSANGGEGVAAPVSKGRKGKRGGDAGEQGGRQKRRQCARCRGGALVTSTSGERGRQHWRVGERGGIASRNGVGWGREGDAGPLSER